MICFTEEGLSDELQGYEIILHSLDDMFVNEPILQSTEISLVPSTSANER